MAYYPPPPYYPPQPVIVQQPAPVVYAGATPPAFQSSSTVVQKTKNVYGGPMGYSGKSGSRKMYSGKSSYGRAPVTKSRTFNLNINKSSTKPFSSKGKKSSSSKKGKSDPAKKEKKSTGIFSGSKKKKNAASAVPGAPAASSTPKSKKSKRTHRRERKKNARIRDMPEQVGLMLGPQLEVQLADEYTLRALIDKIAEVGWGADGMVHRFKHALFGLCRDHGGVLPVCADVPLDLQYMVAKSLHSRRKQPLVLTFVNEAGMRYTSQTTRPLIDNERTASATFVLPPDTKTTLNGKYSLEFQLGDRVYTHTDVFTEHARTIHGNGETFHWLINLYDPAHGSAYYKFMVPVPTLELTMARSRTEENVYVVSQAVLVVDHNPRKHFFTLPLKGSDVVQVPALLPRPHVPYKAHMRDNVTLQRAIHAEMESRFTALMGDSANRWDFRCSVGARDGSDGSDHRVFLGTVGEAGVAYAIMAMLADKKMLDRVNDPEFIKDVLASDENGVGAIKMVTGLYDRYHAAHEGARTAAHQDFPSLLQLLVHTSGLPAARSLRCDQVRAYYLKVINMLSGSEDAAPPELSYDQRERAVIAEFNTAPSADNDADADVGPTDNTLEAFLVAMFVRRFAAGSVMSMRAPGDIINAYLRPGDFKMEWGASLAGGSSAIADPLIFSSCATTTFSGLTSHVRMLTDELAQPSRADSIFFRMLSTRIPVTGEDADIVHSVGWTQQRVNDKLDLLFVGSTNDSIDTIVAMIVPQLNYYAIFHEMSADFDLPLRTTVDGVIDAALEVLDLDSVRAQYESIPDRVRLSVSKLSRARKAWDTSFLDYLPDDFAVSAALPSESMEFVDPFVVQTQRRLRSVRFVRDEDTNGVLARLVFSTGEEIPLVYDPRRSGYYARLFKNESALGPEAVIAEEYIQFDGKIYIRRADFEDFSQRYLSAYNAAIKMATTDVFRTKLSTVIKQGTLVTVTPAMAFSLDAKIGSRTAAAVLGGAALGATAAALAPRVWGPVAPIYPYAYPYHPGVIVPPYYYNPYGHWGRRHRHHRRRPWRR